MKKLILATTLLALPAFASSKGEDMPGLDDSASRTVTAPAPTIDPEMEMLKRQLAEEKAKAAELEKERMRQQLQEMSIANAQLEEELTKAGPSASEPTVEDKVTAEANRTVRHAGQAGDKAGKEIGRAGKKVSKLSKKLKK
jgi:hypothetical protein